MKRYVNFIIGLIVIFTFINPFIKLTSVNLDEKVFNYDSEPFNLDDYEDISKKREELVEKIYLEKISEEVKKIVEENKKYFVVSVDTTVEKNIENYGVIKKMNIILSFHREDTQSEKIQVKKINISKENHNKDNKDNEEYEKIREKVSNKLGIDKELIYISLRDEEMK